MRSFMVLPETGKSCSVFVSCVRAKLRESPLSPTPCAGNVSYLYGHPAGDKEVGGGGKRPEEGLHHERKNNAEIKIWNHFEIK